MIALEKIKAEVVNATGTQSVQPEASRSAYMYSVSIIDFFVNGKEYPNVFKLRMLYVPLRNQIYSIAEKREIGVSTTTDSRKT